MTFISKDYTYLFTLFKHTNPSLTGTVTNKSVLLICSWGWMPVLLTLLANISFFDPCLSFFASQWGRLIRGKSRQCFILFVFPFYFFFSLLLSISSHPGCPPKPSSVVERGISPLTPTSLHPACVGPHFPVFPQSLSSHPFPSSPRLSLSSVGDVSSYGRLLHPPIHSPVLSRITSTPRVTDNATVPKSC